MKRIKTKIRKFLGIDFTCRKLLYSELIDCYDNLEAQYKNVVTLKDEKTVLEEKIRTLHDEKAVLEEKIETLDDKIINQDRMIWDYEDEIHRLRCMLDDLLNPDIEEEQSN